MRTTDSLADHFRAEARRRLDRVEPSDQGRNARIALALIDAAGYVLSLDESDPAIVAIAATGCFGPGGFEPDEERARLITGWSRAPEALLDALAGQGN